jgi:hypothetical protein
MDGSKTNEDKAHECIYMVQRRGLLASFQKVHAIKEQAVKNIYRRHKNKKKMFILSES